MKKFMVFLIVVLASMPAMATIWSVDFESGFTASSGTPHVFNGDLANPGDTTKELHIEADPVNSSNKALDVEYIVTTLPRTYLAYTGLPGSIQPDSDITISARYYLSEVEGNRSVMPFNLNGGTVDVDGSANQVHVAFDKKSTGWTATIFAYNGFNLGGYYTSQVVALPPLESGWHDIVLSWDYLGWSEELQKVSADVALILDDEIMYSGVMGWADFDASMLSVGCRWNGGAGVSKYWIDGNEYGDLVDDVMIIPEPATLMLLGIGAVLLRKRK
ncbi:MAG: hypothetical protein A2Y10_02395 [Planctomycetes bacterium GWF2_41_51]|nr:MAG: hypothetical protein A2Y10_02395 [Planctomycetes bacterium GWF2_41_51]